MAACVAVLLLLVLLRVMPSLVAFLLASQLRLASVLLGAIL
jgi:hypothetical protein